MSVLVVAQSSSEIPEGLMNNPVYIFFLNTYVKTTTGARQVPLQRVPWDFLLGIGQLGRESDHSSSFSDENRATQLRDRPFTTDS